MKNLLSCRHPEASGRLSFSIVVSRLSQPENQLLKYAEEDVESSQLGAPLEIGLNLHTDLGHSI